MHPEFLAALERAGATLEEVREGAETGTGVVQDTREYRRILALPRRDPYEGVEELRYALTDALRLPGPWAHEIRPDQAVAIREAYEQGGFFGGLGVGKGKTLISWVLPYIFGAKRPVLLVPSNLVGKTRREFADHYSRMWRGPNLDAYQVAAYEWVAHPAQRATKGSGRLPWLERYAPDLLILDEGSATGNRGSVITKCVDDFRARFPEVPVVWMSGTPSSTSIQQYAHCMGWALGAGAPVPAASSWSELERWGGALNKSAKIRIRPGVLKEFLTDEERERWTKSAPDDQLDLVRAGYGRRLAQTPGVLLCSDDDLPCSLLIDHYQVPEREMDRAIDKDLEILRRKWRTPDGWEFEDAFEQARHAREMLFGLWYYWHPRPPQPWIDRRSEYAQACRYRCAHNRQGITSHGALVQEILAGREQEIAPIYWAWIAERDRERARTGHRHPPTAAQWISDEALVQVAKWLGDAPPTIVWVEHIHFAQRLAQHTGLTYYHQGGLSADGRPIEYHPVGQHLIASRKANRLGRNLQGWANNLLLCSPEEQLLGRTHRSGQLAPQVRSTLYLSGLEHVHGYWEARAGADYVTHSLQSPQKLSYADTIMPTAMDLPIGPRWQKMQRAPK